MKRLHWLSGVAVAAFAPLAPSPLLAQEADGAQQTRDVVTVTARKKEESLLDAPLSVTAITDEAIDAAGFQSVLDIAKYTPGLQIESYNSIPGRYDSTPFIRGVVFDNTDALRQTVSLFIDGVYVSGGNQMIGVEDVQRVEVIKGPQSAQFGRSTFAGAINYITLDPSDEFKGKLTALAATRDEYEIRGSVEGPLVGDVLTARISGRYSFNGGHYTNFNDPSQELGEESTWSAGAMVLFQPTDNFRTKIRAFYSEIDDGPAAAVVYPATNNCGPFAVGGETFPCGTIPGRLPADLIGTNTTDADFEAFIADAATRNAGGPVDLFKTPDRFGVLRDGFRFSVDSVYDVNDNLGVKAIVGYSNETAFSLYDFDSQPTPNFTLYAGREFEDIQAELNLFGSAFDDQLTWSLGGSYYKLDYETNGAFGVQAFGQSSSFGNVGARSFAFVDTYGLYGLLNYDLTDMITLGFEARYQWDTIDETVPGDPDTSLPGSPATFENFLPRGIIEFKPFDGTLFYASYSEGNLPGGFNDDFFALSPSQVEEARAQFAGIGPTYAEETLKNYEIGWKQSGLLNGRANIALAAYFMQRTDQVTQAVAEITNLNFPVEPNPTFTETFRINEAASEIFGVEFEGNWYPTDELSMRGTLAYTNAEISDFPASADCGDFGDVFLTCEGFIGQRAERYPEWQGTYSVTYETPLSNMGVGFGGTDATWFARGDLFYSTGFFLSTPNLGDIEETTDLNLRTGIRTDQFMIELFATNVLDEDSPATANNFSDNVNFGLFTFTVDATQIGLRDRRQFGGRVTLNF